MLKNVAQVEKRELELLVVLLGLEKRNELKEGFYKRTYETIYRSSDLIKFDQDLVELESLLKSLINKEMLTLEDGVEYSESRVIFTELGLEVAREEDEKLDYYDIVDGKLTKVRYSIVDGIIKDSDLDAKDGIFTVSLTENCVVVKTTYYTVEGNTFTEIVEEVEESEEVEEVEVVLDFEEIEELEDFEFEQYESLVDFVINNTVIEENKEVLVIGGENINNEDLLFLKCLERIREMSSVDGLYFKELKNSVEFSYLGNEIYLFTLLKLMRAGLVEYRLKNFIGDDGLEEISEYFITELGEQVLVEEIETKAKKEYEKSTDLLITIASEFTYSPRLYKEFTAEDLVESYYGVIGSDLENEKVIEQIKRSLIYLTHYCYVEKTKEDVRYDFEYYELTPNFRNWLKDELIGVHILDDLISGFDLYIH